MKVILFRHAESFANRSNSYSSEDKDMVTPEGLEEFKGLVREFKSEHIEAIFCSDYARTSVSSKELSKILNVPVVTSPALRGIATGLFEGKTTEELKQKHPELLRARYKDRYRSKYPEGESYADVEQRIRPFIEMLKQKYAGKTIAIVSHRSASKIILGTLLGMKPSKLVQIDQPHGCVYVLGEKGGRMRVNHFFKGRFGRGLVTEKQTKRNKFYKVKRRFFPNIFTKFLRVVKRR
jgi:probable phosphoglycerate mutase